MSVTKRITFGLIVVFSAILAAWASNHWYATRIFIPLKIDVSLIGDKTQTAGFNVNLRETYSVGIDVDYSVDDYMQGGCGASRLSSFRWRVFRIGKGARREQEPWADSVYFQKQGMYSDRFRANPGKYEVDWQVSPEATCLNSRHPRLSVETTSEDSDELVVGILFVSLLVALPAAGLLMHSFSGLLIGLVGMERPLRIFPDIALKNVIAMRRHRPIPLMANLPVFAPSFICVLIILISIFMTHAPPTNRGFLVHFDKSRPAIWVKSPWTETTSVYVNGLNGFYVNGKHVATKDLAERLKEELGKQMSWTVYFEADENVRFSDAEYAMNTIQHLGAKLVWLTPKSRTEIDQKMSERNFGTSQR